MQAQLAGIHLGEEVLSQEREQPEREQAKSQEANHEHPAILQRGFEQLLVAPAEVFKLVLEATLEAAQERLGSFRAMLVTAHDEHDQGWDESSRQQITGQHGEAHGLRQRYEQKFCHARQEEHGHKHDADAERGDKRRHGDLLGAVEDGLLHLLAHGKVALDVFDFHRGIIDQDADGERQSAQGHDVDGLANRAQHDDRDEDRERNGDGNDDRGAPIAEEDENHDGSKSRCDQSLAQHALDRRAHEQGLVKQRGDFQLRRQRLCRLHYNLLDPVDNFQRGAVPDLVHRHQRPTVSILAHDVRLR